MPVRQVNVNTSWGIRIHLFFMHRIRNDDYVRISLSCSWICLFTDREDPIAEALKRQIEVQQRLQEQLEVNSLLIFQCYH